MKQDETKSGGDVKTRLFEQLPVPLAVCRLALPTVLSQIAAVLYSFADAWFVGRSGNPDALAALAAATPIYVITTAVAGLFGVGGTGVIARCLGKNDRKAAKGAFLYSAVGAVVLTVIYSAVIAVFGNRLVGVIGAKGAVRPYAQSYIFITAVVGGLPAVLGPLFAQLIRSAGYARTAGLGIAAGALANIALDPLFMFVLLPPGNEVNGAAFATLTSNLLTAVFFAVFIIAKKDSVISFRRKGASLDAKILRDVITTGLPAALSVCLAMISNVVANSLMSEYGSAAVAGLGVAKRATTLAFNINMGITQGVLALIAYSFSSGNYARMKKTVTFTFCVTASFSIICFWVYRAFSNQIVSFFIDEPETVRFGGEFLSIISIAVPLCALTFAVNTVFQAVGKKARSLLLSVLRKGALDIPSMFLLRASLGISGILFATPLAEALSALAAVLLLLPLIRQIKAQAQDRPDSGRKGKFRPRTPPNSKRS